jgi:hypothetical protein
MKTYIHIGKAFLIVGLMLFSIISYSQSVGVSNQAAFSPTSLFHVYDNNVITNGTVTTISGGTAMTSGTVLAVTGNGTMVTPGYLANFTANSLTTGTGLALNVNNLTTGTGFSLVSTGTGITTGGNLFLAQTGSTGAPTNGLIRFQFSGAHTNNGFQIDDATATGTATALTVSALTTGTGLSVSSTNAAATGNAFITTSNSTGASVNGIVRFNFTGAHTNNGFQIDDATATGKGMVLNVNSLTTGTGLSVASSSVTSGKLVDIEATNAASTGTGLYVNNTAQGANAIYAAGGGAVNYSAIFASTSPTGAGTAYDVAHSNHTIYAVMNNNNAYSFALYGSTAGAPNPSGGVLGEYNATADIGILGFYNGTEIGVYGVGTGTAATSVPLGGGGGGEFFSSNAGVYGYGDATASSWGVFGKTIAVTGGGAIGVSGVDVNDVTGAGVAGSVLGSWYFPGAGVSGVTQGAAGVFGTIGQTTSSGNGTGYGITTVNAGVAGQYLGNHTYSFGLIGQTDPAQNTKRTGGVIGIQGLGGAWGSLGYYSNGNTSYGVYGTTAYGNGAGATHGGTDSVITGTGGGFYGGLIGVQANGDEIGIITSGKVCAAYNIGNTYTSGSTANIVTTSTQKIPVYSVTSTQVKVYADGTAQLRNGTCRVKFENSFVNVISNNKPTVTVTANGDCNGLYISSVDATGFNVTELNKGNSNVEFSWIAIGSRIDGTPVPISSLLDMNFDSNLKGVVSNENNPMETGAPVWYDGKSFHFTSVPDHYSVKIPVQSAQKMKEK